MLSKLAAPLARSSRGMASLAVQNLKLGAATALPTMAAGQVSIAMIASPVHHADTKGGSGVGGSEGLGRVTAVGSGVSHLQEGDWVVPSLGFGAWCTEAVLEAASVTKVPSDIPAAYAATMSSDSATAYRLLHDYGLSSGDWLIQSDATSPVGVAVVQLAREMGVHTINVVDSEAPSGDKALSLLTNLGGDINCSDLYVHSHGMRSALEGKKVKLAICGVNGEVNTHMARMLQEGGVMVTTSPDVNAKAFALPKEVKVTHAHLDMAAWYKQCNAVDKATMLGAIASAVREEKLRHFFQEHDFDDFAWALKQAADVHSLRKVVLRMDGGDRMAQHDALPAEAYEVFETDYK